MARYAREYGRRYDRHLHEPGWMGGGLYPGASYRTEGYRVGERDQRSYSAEYEVRRRTGRANPPSRKRSSPSRYTGYGTDYPTYSDAAVPPAVAVDLHGGGYGPSYYTGGYSGRQLRRSYGATAGPVRGYDIRGRGRALPEWQSQLLRP